MVPRFPLLAVLALSAGAFARAAAADAIYAGADLSTGGDWRTSSVAKPLDGDGDGIFGTDGYLLVRSPLGDLLSNPTYATVTRLAASTFYGGAGTVPPYVAVDDPLGGSDVRTGTWYATGSVTGQEQDLAQIEFSAAATVRIGVLIDNHDYADISPDRMRVRQTLGGSADSGLVNSFLEANRDGDWYFFDIVGAKAGDRFVLSGTNARLGSLPQNSNGIGAITFDASRNPVPEPATLLLLLLGAGMLRGASGKIRRRVGR